MKELEFDYNAYHQGFNYGWEALEKDFISLDRDATKLSDSKNRTTYNNLIKFINAIKDPVGIYLIQGVNDAYSEFKESVLEKGKTIPKNLGKEFGE